MNRATMAIGMAALAAAALLAGSASAANLLTNGDFEAGANPVYPSSVPASGDVRGIPLGWMQLSDHDNVDIVDNSYTQGSGPSDPQFGVILAAQSGTHFLDRNGANNLGGIYQDVSGLAVGATVDLSLYAGMWAQNGAGSLIYSLIDPTTNSILASDIYTVTPAWVNQTLSAIVPLSGMVRVQIAANTAFQAAPGLDNVSLTVESTSDVPEPAGWAMMIGGFGMIGAAQRRRHAMEKEVRA